MPSREGVLVFPASEFERDFICGSPNIDSSPSKLQLTLILVSCFFSYSINLELRLVLIFLFWRLLSLSSLSPPLKIYPFLILVPSLFPFLCNLLAPCSPLPQLTVNSYIHIYLCDFSPSSYSPSNPLPQSTANSFF